MGMIKEANACRKCIRSSVLLEEQVYVDALIFAFCSLYKREKCIHSIVFAHLLIDNIHHHVITATPQILPVALHLATRSDRSPIPLSGLLALTIAAKQAIHIHIANVLAKGRLSQDRHQGIECSLIVLNVTQSYTMKLCMQCWIIEIINTLAHKGYHVHALRRNIHFCSITPKGEERHLAIIITPHCKKNASKGLCNWFSR
jgi:hypothetical protein